MASRDADSDGAPRASADVLLSLDGDALVRCYAEFKAVWDAEGRGLTLTEFVSCVLSNTAPRGGGAPPPPPDGDDEEEDGPSVLDLTAAEASAGTGARHHASSAAASSSSLAGGRTSEESLALVRSLIEVYRQVDVNGDAEMSWSEFTAFLTEAGAAATSSRSVRAAFVLAHDGHFHDELSRGSAMVGLRYHPEVDAFVALEGDAKLVRVYTPLLKLARTIDASYAVRRSKRATDRSVLVAHAFCKLRDGVVPKQGWPRMLAVLLSNYTVGLWGFTAEECPFHGILPRVSIEHSPVQLVWSPAAQLLFVGCSNGRIFGYDVVFKRLVLSLGYAAAQGGFGFGHDDVVLSMCCAGPRDDALYSAGLDGRVLLWEFLDVTASPNPGKPRVRKQLQTQAGATVRKLLFVEPLQLVLGLTAKNMILGWEAGAAEVSLRIEAAGAAGGGGGGRGPRFVDFALCRTTPAPRLVTIDELSTLRVWDIAKAGTGSCPCTFVLNIEGVLGGLPVTAMAMTGPPVTRGPNWRDAILPPPPSTMERLAAEKAAARAAEDGNADEPYEKALGLAGDLVVATGRLFRYTSVAAERAEPPAALVYNEALSCFVSAVASDVVLWNADSGRMSELFQEAVPSDVTCTAFDDRQRKLFCGTLKGEVVALNLSNGSAMKSGALHTAPVTALHYAERDRLLVSASWDGSLVVFDDEPEEELDALRVVTYAHSVDITALALSAELALIVSGDRDGFVKVWDFTDLKLLAVFREHFAVVTAVACFGAWPFFVSGDTDGRLVLCSTRSGAPICTGSSTSAAGTAALLLLLLGRRERRLRAAPVRCYRKLPAPS